MEILRAKIQYGGRETGSRCNCVTRSDIAENLAVVRSWPNMFLPLDWLRIASDNYWRLDKQKSNMAAVKPEVDVILERDKIHKKFQMSYIGFPTCSCDWSYSE